jgi:hypothetical protein
MSGRVFFSFLFFSFLFFSFLFFFLLFWQGYLEGLFTFDISISTSRLDFSPSRVCVRKAKFYYSKFRYMSRKASWWQTLPCLKGELSLSRATRVGGFRHKQSDSRKASEWLKHAREMFTWRKVARVKSLRFEREW